MSEIEISRGWKPSALGWIVGEHALYYGREWRLGQEFEAKVAAELGAWMLRATPGRDQLLLARDEAGFLASLVVDGSGPMAGTSGARLRFFIAGARGAGRGLGRRLLAQGMAFVAEAGFSRAFLTTFAGLDAARALYEGAGFRLASEVTDTTWGRPLQEQTFVWGAP